MYMLIYLQMFQQDTFFSSQANGLDERFNQTIQAMLVKRVDRRQVEIQR